MTKLLENMKEEQIIFERTLNKIEGFNKISFDEITKFRI